MKHRRILVVTGGHLGDLVSALPALRDLRHAYPEARITAVVNEYVTEALEGCPYVDKVVPGFGFRNRDRVRLAIWRLWQLSRIVGRHDTYLGLKLTPSSATLLGLLSGARVRVGYDRGRAARLLTHHVDLRLRRRGSSRMANLRPLEALGIPVDPGYPRLDWISPAGRRRVEAMLSDAGLPPGSRFAVAQLSSHWGCNEWGSEKWAELCDYLWERHRLPTVTTGTTEAYELVKYQEVARAASHPPISLHGKTSILELFDVVDRAALVVAGDSALTQVALAQQTPSVIMFGLAFHEENEPLPEEVATLIEPIQYTDQPGDPPRNLNCPSTESSCHQRFCRENNSLRKALALEVQERIDRILSRRPAPAQVG